MDGSTERRSTNSSSSKLPRSLGGVAARAKLTCEAVNGGQPGGGVGNSDMANLRCEGRGVNESPTPGAERPALHLRFRCPSERLRLSVPMLSVLSLSPSYTLPSAGAPSSARRTPVSRMAADGAPKSFPLKNSRCLPRRLATFAQALNKFAQAGLSLAL